MRDRRNLYRASTCLAPLSAVELTPERQLVPLNLLILNISGGGMLCQVNRELELGTIVQVTFRVRDLQTLTVNARVVHVSPGPACDSLIGCRFVDLSHADQDALVGFIFGLQAAALRMRWDRRGAAE